MACFLAPATAAIIATAAKNKISSRYHFEWLLSMLWGGVLMLIIEHIAHREIVPYFPFFTAGWNEMWPEILRIGVPMIIAIFVVWTTMVFAVNYKNKLNAAKARI